MKTRLSFFAAALVVLAGVSLALPKFRRSAAEKEKAWPERPVQIIVPLASGSGLDLTARLFAERLAEHWGRPVLVENRPGADGIVGVTAFLAADPSEVLLFSLSSPYAVNAFTHKSLPYEPQRDLVPLSGGTEATGVMAVSAAVEAKSLKDLVALVRERPRRFFWTATPGLAELVFSAFLKSERLEMTFVPYTDVATPFQDLARGRLHLMLTGLTTIEPQVRAGSARLLAVHGMSRSLASPDIPTVAEAGYPSLGFEGLYGFYARRELPAALREKISADIQRVGANPALISRLATMGQQVCVGTPEAFTARLERQRATAARVVETLGMKPE